MDSELASVGRLNWADEVDELDKSREAEAASQSPPEPSARPQQLHSLVFGGVPDDFEPWEVDRMMADLLPAVRVVDRRRLPGQAVYELDVTSREDAEAVCDRLNGIEIQGKRVWAQPLDVPAPRNYGGYGGSSYGRGRPGPPGQYGAGHAGYDNGPYGAVPYGAGRGQYGDRPPYPGHRDFPPGRPSDMGPYGRGAPRDFSPPRGPGGGPTGRRPSSRDE
ncbi:hypothetical protein Agub_g10969, partial [Astrephomene gubernaculifera]